MKLAGLLFVAFVCSKLLAIDPFALKDPRGKTYSLEDFKDQKLVVIAFLGVDCPLTKLYAPRLVKLHETYSKKKVAFVGINANSQDAVSKISDYAKTHKIEFPVLKDVGNALADKMGATRTPEVFVLNEKREIVYRGRIDDQYAIGINRPKAERADLEEAIKELLDDKKVAVAETKPAGCLIGKLAVAKNAATVTYTKDIAPFLQKRCVQCHREGSIAPLTLTTYKDVRGWADMIGEVVKDGRMPPWHANPKIGKFSNDRSLTGAEKELVATWVKEGAPEGEARDLAAPAKFVEGWRLSAKPDLVINVTDKPFRVRAEGELAYEYFTVDPGFKEDVWVKEMEIQPGNLSVVHHVLVFANDTGRPQFGPGMGYLAAFAPGAPVPKYPVGMGKKIPAGSKLVFQMHYTPNGSVQFDQTKIGFVFVDKKNLTHEIVTTSAGNLNFEIPARAKNHKIEGDSPAAPIDLQITAMLPHMHLRGKSIQYEALYPGGKTELLLDVPRFDFSWQTGYELAEPKQLPKGTVIRATAYFDNSADNPNNPNPNVAVRFGEQTRDEMMIGYFEVAVPIK